MIDIVAKLHFNPGDVLILHHGENTNLVEVAAALKQVLDGLPFIVPYIFLAPGHQIRKMSREDLEKVLKEVP